MKSSSGEIWKEVDGFTDYFVSNEGRVKSFRTGVERMMKLQKNKYGYMYIRLSVSKRESKHFLVHRLVAMHFLPNTDNKPQVNHVDGDKSNNNLSNLEWVCAKENISHAYSIGLRNNDQLKLNGIRNSKRVSQIDISTGNILKVWESVNSTEKQSGGKYDNAAVHRCCTLKKDTHKGYRWRFEGEEHLEFKRSDGMKCDPVEVGDGDVYTIFDSATEAASILNVGRNSIYRAINQGRKLLGKYTIEYA